MFVHIIFWYHAFPPEKVINNINQPNRDIFVRNVANLLFGVCVLFFCHLDIDDLWALGYLNSGSTLATIMNSIHTFDFLVICEFSAFDDAIHVISILSLWKTHRSITTELSTCEPADLYLKTPNKFHIICHYFTRIGIRLKVAGNANWEIWSEDFEWHNVEDCQRMKWKHDISLESYGAFANALSLAVASIFRMYNIHCICLWINEKMRSSYPSFIISFSLTGVCVGVQCFPAFHIYNVHYYLYCLWRVHTHTYTQKSNWALSIHIFTSFFLFSCPPPPTFSGAKIQNEK